MPPRRLQRRTLLKGSASLGVSQLLGAPFIIGALAEQPVKIGMVNSLTGLLSPLALSEADGARYAAAEISRTGGILGRPAQLLIEDSASNISNGVQKTRKLIERDQVAAILGDVNSGVAYAMAQVTNDHKLLHIVPGGHADPLTGGSCKWNVFRVCNSTAMIVNALTPALIKKFGNKWFFITPELPYGHMLQDSFIKGVSRNGGTYDSEYMSFGATDFASALNKAKSFKPDVVVNNMEGPAQIALNTQFNQSSMAGDVGLGGTLFEQETIKSAGPNAQAGMWAMEWWWNLPNAPHAAKFASEFHAATGKAASARTWFGYVAMHSVRLAAARAKSLDATAMTKAMEDMELPPEIALQAGQVRYRAGDHQLMGNILLGEVHPPKAGPEDVYTATYTMTGEQAAGPVAGTGCKLETPA